GPATLTVTNSIGASTTYNITIAAVAPGLFSADFTGSGQAAAQALIVAADGTRTLINTANTTIPLAANTQVFLILYGTGVRGRSDLKNASLTVGGVTAPLTFAGAQGEFPGLDQVDAQIPNNLAGKGEVDARLTVDGVAANVVRVRF